METVCETCGNVGLQKGADGFHYCTACGTQSQHFLEEDLGDFQPLGQDELGRRTFMYAREGNVERQRHEAELKRIRDGLKGPGDDPALIDEDPEAARAREEELLKILSQKPGTDKALEDVRSTLASQYQFVDNVHVLSGTQQMYEPSELPQRLAAHLREVYVQGLQKILQMQCETLVQEFGVSPLICGIVGPIWLRFVAFTRVYEKEWAEEAILLADAANKKKVVTDKKDKEEKLKEVRGSEISGIKKRTSKKKKSEDSEELLVTKTGLKSSKVWMESLKERLPMRLTLAIQFLACWITREPVLPTDITGWAVKGTLPYLRVFLTFQTERFTGPDLKTVQVPELEPKIMFRPAYMTNTRMVEVLAGHIAHHLGLELPPINFYPVSCRLIRELGLAPEGIVSYLQRLYEWYTPDGIWLSARRRGLPSRAFVMAMVIVTLKILYDVDGHAECSLYWPAIAERLKAASSTTKRAKFQTVLESIEKKLMDDALASDFDLKDYLKYCEDFIYPGLKLSTDQEIVFGQLWECFEKVSHEDVAGAADAANEQKQNQHEDHNVNETADISAPNVQHQQQDSQNEYSLGSAEWSRVVATPQQQKSTLSADKPVESTVNKEDIDEEQKEDQVAKQAPPEVSSANAEAASRVQQARSRLLKSISRDLTAGGFKIIPALSQTGTSETTYPMFQLYSVETRKQHVPADYFMLLYACSRLIQVKSSVLHRCVRMVESDLWRMEQRVVQFMGETSDLEAVGIEQEIQEDDDLAEDNEAMDLEELVETNYDEEEEEEDEEARDVDEDD